MRITGRDGATPEAGGGNGKTRSPVSGAAGERPVSPAMEKLLRLADEADGISASDTKFDAPANGTATTERGVFKAYRVACETKGLKITPKELANEFDSKPPSGLNRISDQIKGSLPGPAKSRSQKLKKLTEAVQSEVDEVRQDRSKQMRLSAWFSSLTPADRENITAGPIFEGMASWMQPLGVWVGNNRTNMFNAGHLMDLPPEVVEALPVATREWLAERRETARAYGINTGKQAQQFLDKHFEMTPIDIDGEELPLELEQLCKLEPAFREMLRSHQERGILLCFIKAKAAPEPVLQSLRHLAEAQGAFISHFFAGLIENGELPEFVHKDFAQVAKVHNDAYRKAHKHVQAGSLEARLIDARLFDELEGKLDFVSSARLIMNFADHVMGIVQVGGDPAEHEELARMNRAIDGYFGDEWAIHRTRTDDSERVSESVLGAAKTMSWAVPTAEGVQAGLKLDWLARLVAGSGDNAYLELRGELPLLVAAGVPRSDVIKRATFFAGAVAADVYLTANIDTIWRAFGAHVAAGAYGVAATGIPLATMAWAIQYFASQYRKLGRDGKLPYPGKPSNEERAQRGELESKDGLINAVMAALDEMEAAPAVRDATIDAIRNMDEIPPIDTNPDANAMSVGYGEAMRKGAEEVMVVNRMQGPLLISSAILIALDAALGGMLLKSGALEAVSGGAEGPVAFGGASLIALIGAYLRNRRIKQQEPLGLLDEGPTETDGEIMSQ